MLIGDRIARRRKELGLTQDELAQRTGYKSKAAISKIETNINDITQSMVIEFAKALDTSVAYLMGWEDSTSIKPPSVSSANITFPVLGEIAAGYEHVAYEDWTGDTVEIPASYLKGRTQEDFFVLQVVGDSMYPTYQAGDIVLVLRQSTMNYSGEIGVVMYGDDKATLKRVEYVMGEDWMRLSPVNPQYPPALIRGEDLEHCRVLGIPKLLIREIKQE